MRVSWFSIIVHFSYFDTGTEDADADLAYQPAPGSPSHKDTVKDADSEGSDDPLDAFMQGIEVESHCYPDISSCFRLFSFQTEVKQQELIDKGLVKDTSKKKAAKEK